MQMDISLGTAVVRRRRLNSLSKVLKRVLWASSTQGSLSLEIGPQHRTRPFGEGSMSASDLEPRYVAYMLRMWEVRGDQPGNATYWRFSLEDPHSGERVGFSDLPSLVAFLETQIGQENAAEDE